MSSAPEPPVASDFDPLRFVYLLVLDGQGPPDLLTHLDPSRVKETAERFSRSNQVGWFHIDEAQRLLFEKYPDTHPHPLWRAWMETTQSAAVERLRAELLGKSSS
jgi:hypothetical protein